jgi:hypothetical protein
MAVFRALIDLDPNVERHRQDRHQRKQDACGDERDPRVLIAQSEQAPRNAEPAGR